MVVLDIDIRPYLYFIIQVTFNFLSRESHGMDLLERYLATQTWRKYLETRVTIKRLLKEFPDVCSVSIKLMPQTLKTSPESIIQNIVAGIRTFHAVDLISVQLYKRGKRYATLWILQFKIFSSVYYKCHKWLIFQIWPPELQRSQECFSNTCV